MLLLDGLRRILRRVVQSEQQSLKTPPTTETKARRTPQNSPTFGARRLIREFDLPISHCALERNWREHGLMKKRRRKYQRKQDLAHIKAS